MGMSNRFDQRSRRRILGQWKRSGLSSHEFARRAGVSHATLYKWRREFAAPSAFVEVVPGNASAASEPDEAGLDPAIQIMLPGGVVVQVGPGVDEGLLRRVVRALA